MEVWPPRSQTWNFIFLYCSVSTLKPMVGMVWIASSESFCRRSANEAAHSQPSEQQRRSVRRKPDAAVAAAHRSADNGTAAQLEGVLAAQRRSALTQDGRLAGVVEAEDEDADLLAAEEALEYPREEDAHRCRLGWVCSRQRAVRTGGEKPL